jgi:hypothetical protein
MIKSRIKETLRIAIALLAGFVGSQIHTGSIPVTAASDTVLRAQRFELLDDSGRVVAYWASEPRQGPYLCLLNRDGSKATVWGLHDGYQPFLDMLATDSTPRLTIRLETEDQRPLLAMSDSKWEGRMLLGFIAPDYASPTWDNWALVFRAPHHSDVASMSMRRDAVSGRMVGRINLIDESGRSWNAPGQRAVRPDR